MEEGSSLLQFTLTNMKNKITDLVRVSFVQYDHLSETEATVSFRVEDHTIMFLIPERYYPSERKRKLTRESFTFFGKEFKKWLDHYQTGLTQDNIIAFIKANFDFVVKVPVDIESDVTADEIKLGILNAYKDGKD